MPDENDDFEQRYAKRRRHDRIVGLAVGGTIVLAVAGIAVYVATRPPPLCDPKQLDAFMSTKQIPATAIGEVCKLPPPLAKTLRSMQAMPPQMAHLPFLQLVAEHHELFAPTCPNLPGAIAASMRDEPGRLTALVIEKCGASAFPFADRATLESSPLDRVLLASAVHTALVDDDANVAGRIARELLVR